MTAETGQLLVEIAHLRALLQEAGIPIPHTETERER
jgi:hypothetical protein